MDSTVRHGDIYVFVGKKNIQQLKIYIWSPKITRKENHENRMRNVEDVVSDGGGESVEGSGGIIYY